MIAVRVQDSPRELRAAVLALRAADKTVRTAVARDMRATMGPEWKAALTKRVDMGGPWRLLTDGAKITGGNPAALVTASGRRKFGSGGGLIPVEHWAGFEYGVSDHTPRRYNRRYTGQPHTVTRDVVAGHPSRNRRGRVIGPTVKAFLPRVAAYWVQSVVRAYLDAAEKGR